MSQELREYVSGLIKRIRLSAALSDEKKLKMAWYIISEFISEEEEEAPSVH